MRNSDVSRLSEPYDVSGSGQIPGPASAIGAHTPMWEKLESTILESLTPNEPYGIGWWAPHPGTSRRILISDHLYTCTASVSTNLVEAAIHRLEAGDWADQHSDRNANAVSFEGGRFIVKAPPPASPMEDLILPRMRLHIVGCVRALAGAMDCMSGTIIGILALPTPILRADFSTVRNLLKRIVTSASPQGQKVQADFAEKLESLISSVGPEGWLDWALKFRNMLVHRGRRIELGQYTPREPVLYGPDHQPIPRARAVTQLPRDPGRSDVEVFLESSNTPVLTEDAEQTLDGLLTSTKCLVEKIAEELTLVWNWRREHPDLLPQPKEQWPEWPSSGSKGFGGYLPGSLQYSPGAMVTHPIVLQRMLAAALDDQTRPKWQSFD